MSTVNIIRFPCEKDQSGQSPQGASLTERENRFEGDYGVCARNFKAREVKMWVLEVFEK